jgi:hypothetical protein
MATRRQPVVVNSPMPTLSEIADVLGIGAKTQRFLANLVNGAPGSKSRRKKSNASSSKTAASVNSQRKSSSKRISAPVGSARLKSASKTANGKPSRAGKATSRKRIAK